jgi:pimeloyl-ACP methyl ester carboxylesterase
MSNLGRLSLLQWASILIILFVNYFLLALLGVLDNYALAVAPLVVVAKIMPFVLYPFHIDELVVYPKSKSLPPVFVLHGLGERTWTMSPFVWFLNAQGWSTVYTPHWPANTCLLEECLDALDKEMQLYANKSEPIMIVGNSMGGVMAYHLHTRGWNILVSYSVAAPIKGSGLYRILKSSLPSAVFNFFHRPGHDYLERTEQPPAPPHPWFTLGFHLGVEFDLHVFLSDMPNANHASTLGTHFSLAYDPFVWGYLERGLKLHLPAKDK